MYGGHLSRTAAEIEAVKRHLRTSEGLRRMLSDGAVGCKFRPECFDTSVFNDAPDSIQWRIIDFCSGISRVYALYESFIHRIVRDYVGFVEANIPFYDLEASFSATYRAGMSRLIAYSDRARYANIALPSLVDDYARALAGEAEYRLEPEAFLTHERNLRLNDLGELFAGCGIAGMVSWIDAHPKMKQFFSLEDRFSSTAASELKAFVQGRNDAAHGSLTVDEIEDTGTLIEFADFVVVLCEIISERVQREFIDKSSTRELATEHGFIAELFRDKKVLVGLFTGTISVGSSVYIYGQSYCTEAKVESIHLDDVEIDGASFLEATDLGIRVDVRGKVGAALKSITTIKRGAAADRYDGAEDDQVVSQQRERQAPGDR